MNKRVENIDKFLSMDLDDFNITVGNTPTITNELVEELKGLIKKYGSSKVLPFIKATIVNKVPVKFNYTKDCDGCGLITTFKIPTTHFKEMLYKEPIKRYCDSCRDIKAKEKLKFNEEWYEQRRIKREADITRYIDLFLTPNNKWKKELSINDKWSSINTHYSTDKQIVNHILKMNYYDFLKTPYWVAVSLKKKKQAKFRCQMCSSKGELQTHHSTYEIHGYEVDNMNSLTVLCSSCHNKFHKETQ